LLAHLRTDELAMFNIPTEVINTSLIAVFPHNDSAINMDGEANI
jgi:hypothetical protein